ncbi:unnamed protein product, partial [Prorocentrum cordatum]
LEGGGPRGRLRARGGAGRTLEPQLRTDRPSARSTTAAHAPAVVMCAVVMDCGGLGGLAGGGGSPGALSPHHRTVDGARLVGPGIPAVLPAGALEQRRLHPLPARALSPGKLRRGPGPQAGDWRLEPLPGARRGPSGPPEERKLEPLPSPSAAALAGLQEPLAARCGSKPLPWRRGRSSGSGACSELRPAK